MTQTSASKPDLGAFGVFGHYAQFGTLSEQQLREIESLGYGAIWAGGSPPAELDWVDPILAATEKLQVATGIVNIWSAAPGPVAESFQRIEAAHPGRFLLGIGVGHREATVEYRKPLDALNDYLDKLDEYGVPQHRRVIAALGPKVLALSAARSAGAHPYLTTPEHTKQARAVLGPDAFLAPEHKAVLNTDAEQARGTGRQMLDIYLGLTNYRNNFQRLGFTDEDLTKPGSDRFIDAVVAHGAPGAVATQLQAHRDAGADHVPVQVLTAPENLLPTLTELAGALGLR